MRDITVTFTLKNEDEERLKKITKVCGKPTPLGVGWIAKNIKIMCI